MVAMHVERHQGLLDVPHRNADMIEDRLHFARGGSAVFAEASADAAAARERGIETVVEFFGRELAARLVAEGRRADLLAANNVKGHRDLPELTAAVRPELNPTPTEEAAAARAA